MFSALIKQAGSSLFQCNLSSSHRVHIWWTPNACSHLCSRTINILFDKRSFQRILGFPSFFNLSHSLSWSRIFSTSIKALTAFDKLYPPDLTQVWYAWEFSWHLFSFVLTNSVLGTHFCKPKANGLTKSLAEEGICRTVGMITLENCRGNKKGLLVSEDFRALITQAPTIHKRQVRKINVSHHFQISQRLSVKSFSTVLQIRTIVVQRCRSQWDRFLRRLLFLCNGIMICFWMASFSYLERIQSI